MAIVGHWVPAFLVGYVMPQASQVLLCKLTMLSDVLFAFFAVFKLERVGVFVNFMSMPPSGTQHLISEWKDAGLWNPSYDKTPGEDGFQGFVPCCFPFYADLSYSHSLELMAIISIPIVALLWVRWRITLSYAFVILMCLVSHPLIDMLFHDAYILMGDRSKSRVSLAIWQIPWNGPFTFALEAGLAYGSYRLWMSARKPVKDDDDTQAAILHNAKQFWMIAIGHSMLSFYVLAPIMNWLFHRYAPGAGFMADSTWSSVLLCFMVLTWSAALFPLYRLEIMTVPLTYGKLEVEASANETLTEDSESEV
eukprot:TRINITY_DN17770_c0_g1_i2.p1 TRINITY_DN17770_c0_g1~~TRINITY_DN17770_c0_g1_i2.p1  ORF type:complete len:320 (-),score=33.48 TRINITY_DN17770_c0_g1_i2:82-1005(-)